MPVLSRLILENKGMRAVKPKKGEKKSSKRTQLWNFTPHLFTFRAFIMLHPSKQHDFFEFVVEKRYFMPQKGHCMRIPDAVSD